MENKEQAKKEIQAICEKYNVGIAMLPKVQQDGILIQMDIVSAPSQEEEVVVKEIISKENETLTKNSDTSNKS